MYDVMASLHILINFFIIASGVPDAGGTPHVRAKNDQSTDRSDHFILLYSSSTWISR